MHVRNVHSRTYESGRVAQLERLLETLATPNDALWPIDNWPVMRFRGGRKAGASGGHGPIRYDVAIAEPRRVWFEFTAPRGFEGGHGYEIRLRQEHAVLEHVLEMDTEGLAVVSWPLVFRPMHDALIEDSLDRADHWMGRPPRGNAWSPYVRVLREVSALVLGLR
jgi:hypothetical protein